MAIVDANSPAEMGLVKNIAHPEFERDRDWRSDCSSIGPRMKPRTRGTDGHSSFFMRNPRTPKIRAVQTSNIEFLMLYAPTTDMARIRGARILYGTLATLAHSPTNRRFRIRSMMFPIYMLAMTVHVKSAYSVKINVRVIAAANESLNLAVSDGRFRPDLYFRINVLTLKLPPLRHRREDIPGLVLQMIKETSTEIFEFLQPLVPTLIRPLLDYDFPGNVRELRSIAERFLILLDRARLGELDYMTRLMRECIGETPVLSPSANRLTLEVKDSLRATLEDLERRAISRALRVAAHRDRGPDLAGHLVNRHYPIN